ncbi:hypothetical protein CS022_11445 [Veronia nyctiphanis]|uniref:YitT family protein n=1 Tax=Veronia nyctiphanis TaxID=1278244 RepID=A0A4V1LSW5_9GAMM|nr:YitT family protein [Veronia nyctiphanis]RXJ73118.1 hypothetical protein CS022_11445 [Veronia nyctiphanis]
MSKTIKHTWQEDLVAILAGTFIVAQGVMFLKQAGLLSGGIAGLALLVNQVTDLSFGTLFFVLNLPFYLMAWKRFGRQFAIRSLIAGSLVSIFADMIDNLFVVDWLSPVYSAVIAGLMIGVGMLMVFRHNASLGGFNIFALYCQDKFGLRAGNVQMGIDCAILVASFFVVSPFILLCSVGSAVILNMLLTMNHKPERYQVAPAK